jgi:ribosomal-protein-alanine N-acetyltransferase
VTPTGPGTAALVVRDARWTDIVSLAALEAEVFPDDAWSERSWWAELAERPRREYVVAVGASDRAGDRALLGYGGLDHAGDVADVMTVVVAGPGRGRGLGRTLLDELEHRAAARRAAHVMLEVRADNAAAIGLYTGAGYRTVTTRRGYYQPGGVDALVMRKALRPDVIARGSEDA